MSIHCPQCQGQVYAGTTQTGMVFENCPGVACAACAEKDSQLALLERRHAEDVAERVSQAEKAKDQEIIKLCGEVARLTAAVRQFGWDRE